MAIIKCKMCGGDMELAADKTFGTCEFCGSTMTLPRIDDEQRTAAFNRGNHFRRIGEFDKALSVYERIVREDDTDAEAHWCCALCRFGIEYVEDPATYEWLPTCHRASFDSFLEDVDYKAALQYSDGITRRQYMKDGAKIAEVQRGILATSQNAEPYDVFICYKESDEFGDRTRDSLLAQEIYYQLTEQGRKVFFSRITLEDVAGTQYEPYIFAALNSAKVMVVVGTKQEYLNSVWVKNEWSRFLAMMKKDRHKLLLPCYRDMDPYDMPEQLSVLQSYDMSKIGFIQDLTRGIAKVLNTEKKPVPVKETVVVQQTAAPAANIAPLLKRAFIFLEDGEWNRADDFCEQVLNMDPECALAYVGKLMVELHVQNQSDLFNQEQPFDTSNNFKKAYRFGDDKMRENLTGYIQHINDRNENARLEKLYQEATAELEQANSEKTFKAASKLFAAIKDYKDSADKAELCLEKAEVARLDVLYNAAKNLMAGNKISSYQDAIKRFEALGDWRDSAALIALCHHRIREIETQIELQRQERLRQKTLKERQRIAEIQKNKVQPVRRNRKAFAILFSVLAIVLAVVLVVFILSMQQYNNAVKLMDAGNYEEAIATFEALNGYKDSSALLLECQYLNAVKLSDAGQYDEAIAAFEALNGYKDSSTLLLEHQYLNAVKLSDAGQYDEAIAAFEALNGYKNSAAQIRINQILKQIPLAAEGDYITFGAYEQDNDLTNGKEPIKWLVLKKEDNKALLISRYVLDCQYYAQNGFEASNWEKSDIRTWLNEEFLNAAFTDSEKLLIPTVMVEPHQYQENNTIDQGNATLDQIFLLSYREVKKYFSFHEARKCQPTAYATANGAYGSYFNSTNWWLRTLSRQTDKYNYAESLLISEKGKIDTGSIIFVRGVRPALWVDLDLYTPNMEIESPIKANMSTDAPTSANEATEAPNVRAQENYERGLEQMTKGNTLEALRYFTAAGDYQDAKARANDLRKQYQKYLRCETISAGDKHTAAAKADGTAVAVGYNKDGRCEVSEWTDIIQIDAISKYTYGMKSDGTIGQVSNHGGHWNICGWKNLVDFCCIGPYGLTTDGTVIVSGGTVSNPTSIGVWYDIVDISTGSTGGHITGLKADGSVVVKGSNEYGECDVSDWTDIIAVSPGEHHTVGLKADGTVVAVGRNIEGQCNVSGWSDIVAISAGVNHTVGLKPDGTVIAVGLNDYGQCDVEGWTDIVAINAGTSHTIGLKADGTLVAVGNNEYGQCNVSDWKDIKLPQ